MKLLITFIITLFSFLYQNNGRDFSGSWQLAEDKSEYGIIPKDKTPIYFNIMQNVDTVTIERFSPEVDGSGEYKKYSETLIANVWVRTVRDYDGIIKKSLLKWESKEQFTITSNYFLPDDENAAAMASVESWTLAEKGKECVIVSDISTAEKKGKVKWVFDRKD